MTGWLRIFAARVQLRDQAAYEILTIDDATWAAIQHEPSAKAADLRLARATMPCLKATSPHVQNLMSTLSESPWIIGSGRSLFQLISQYPTFAIGAE